MQIELKNDIAANEDSIETKSQIIGYFGDVDPPFR
jgi:hypothetical protein